VDGEFAVVGATTVVGEAVDTGVFAELTGVVLTATLVVSVTRLTAVVLASVTMTALVVVITVELLAWRFLSRSLMAASWTAMSTKRVASSGSSLCTASIARAASSCTPSRYLGDRWW